MSEGLRPQADDERPSRGRPCEYITADRGVCNLWPVNDDNMCDLHTGRKCCELLSMEPAPSMRMNVCGAPAVGDSHALAPLCESHYRKQQEAARKPLYDYERVVNRPAYAVSRMHDADLVQRVIDDPVRKTGPIRVYVACRFKQRGLARTAARRLGQEGMVMSSLWFEGNVDDADMTPQRVEELAVHTLVAIRQNTDVLVHITLAGNQRGGNLAEFGVALGCKIPTIVVGERTIFLHHHPAVRVVSNMDLAVAQIKALRERHVI